MNGEIIEYKDIEIKKELTVNPEDIARMTGHMQVIKEFVSKSLVEGVDNDYGIVPGVKKKMLLKPGAEKLMKLFGLGVRFRLIDKELDRYENFALYAYEAEIYHLKTGIILSQCEGTANSQEKKYKERAVFANGIKVGTEPTPVCDIINTLKKMAQKRAMVGAVIIATGASDYFSQDEEEVIAQAPVRNVSTTADASKFTGKAEDIGAYVVPVGKHKGSRLRDIETKDLSGYCKWISDNNSNIDGKMKEFMDIAREYLRSA